MYIKKPAILLMTVTLIIGVFAPTTLSANNQGTSIWAEVSPSCDKEIYYSAEVSDASGPITDATYNWTFKSRGYTVEVVGDQDGTINLPVDAPTGTYICRVTAYYGDSSIKSKNLKVDVFEALELTINVVPNGLSGTYSAVVNGGSGEYSYEWAAFPAGITLSDPNASYGTYILDAPGTYTIYLTVTDNRPDLPGICMPMDEETFSG